MRGQKHKTNTAARSQARGLAKAPHGGQRGPRVQPEAPYETGNKQINKYSLWREQLQLFYVSKEPEQSSHLFGGGARRHIGHLNHVRVAVHFLLVRR